MLVSLGVRERPTEHAAEASFAPDWSAREAQPRILASPRAVGRWGELLSHLRIIGAREEGGGGVPTSEASRVMEQRNGRRSGHGHAIRFLPACTCPEKEEGASVQDGCCCCQPRAEGRVRKQTGRGDRQRGRTERHVDRPGEEAYGQPRRLGRDRRSGLAEFGSFRGHGTQGWMQPYLIGHSRQPRVQAGWVPRRHLVRGCMQERQVATAA